MPSAMSIHFESDHPFIAVPLEGETIQDLQIRMAKIVENPYDMMAFDAGYFNGAVNLSQLWNALLYIAREAANPSVLFSCDKSRLPEMYQTDRDYGSILRFAIRSSLIDAAMDTYKKLGAEIVPISMPNMKYGIAAYYIIAPAEASSNLARYDGVGFGLRVDGKDIVDMYIKTRTEGFGDEVKRRILLGTYVLSSGYYDAYYLQAMKVRTLMKQDFDEALKKCDILLTPTAPDTAFKIGQNSGDPLAMYLGDVCTVPLNLAGLPGISIPCGYKDGLPIGMQLIGKALGEATLLRAAYTFEQNRTDLRMPSPMGEVEL